MTNKKASAGFSLVELLMVLGIMSFLSLGAFSFFQYFWAKSMATESETSARMGEAVLERVLFEDLVSLSPSLGSLIKADGAGLPFFDFYQGVPGSRIPDAQRTRQVVLDAAAGGGVIDFVVGAGRASDTQYFPVASAYDAAPSLFAAGALTYKGANSAGFFTNHFSSVWKDGQHFLFFAPTLLRTPGSGAVSPVRPYSFLGVLVGGQIEMDTLDGTWKTDHPLYSGVTISNLDQFFRWLPSIGGSATSVLVTPVKVVRYRLEPGKPDVGRGKFYRSFRQGRAYQEETLFATDLKKIIFKRPDVTTRLIEFELQLKFQGDQ